MKKIKLTKGLEALVSDEDYNYLIQWKWCVLGVKGKEYARRARHCDEDGDSFNVFMHREVAKRAGIESVMFDHKNGNRLDNTRENIRGCTNAENGQNRGKPKNNKSGVKGVSWYKTRGKWRACIYVNKKFKHLGFFDSIDEATTAYNKAALLLHSDFAYNH